MLELAILVLLLIAVLLYLYYKPVHTDTIKEPFTASLSACPPGFKHFYDKNNNDSCCDGIIDPDIGICNPRDESITMYQCTLANGTADMPNCAEILQQIFMEQSKNTCPFNWKYYQSTDTSGNAIRGCVNGSLKTDLSGPLNPADVKCTVYLDDDKYIKVDSCQLQKELLDFNCSGANPTNNTMCAPVPLPNDQSAFNELLSIAFTFPPTANNMTGTSTGYTRPSLERFLLKNYGTEWKNINLNTSKQMADVQYKVHILKSMEESAMTQ
jgi:hypothetical protein